MTPADAIKELEEMKAAVDNVFTFSVDRKREALDLAILALELIKATHPGNSGRWIKKHDRLSWWYECDKCGARPPRNYLGNEAYFSAFCPNCGASMDEEVGE